MMTSDDYYKEEHTESSIIEFKQTIVLSTETKVELEGSYTHFNFMNGSDEWNGFVHWGDEEYTTQEDRDLTEEEFSEIENKKYEIEQKIEYSRSLY